MEKHILDRLHKVLTERKKALGAGQSDPHSRTHRLLERGGKQVAKKLGEEAVEVVVEYMRKNKNGLAEESADLLYFLTLAWADRGLSPKDVWREMEIRFGMPEPQERLLRQTRRKKRKD